MRKDFEVPTPSLYIFSYTMVTCICDWIGITCICVVCVSFKNMYCCRTSVMMEDILLRDQYHRRYCNNVYVYLKATKYQVEN